MKRVFAIFAIAGMLVACGSGDKKVENVKEDAKEMMKEAKEGVENMIEKVDSTLEADVDSIKAKLEEATK